MGTVTHPARGDATTLFLGGVRSAHAFGLQTRGSVSEWPQGGRLKALACSGRLRSGPIGWWQRMDDVRAVSSAPSLRMAAAWRWAP